MPGIDSSSSALFSKKEKQIKIYTSFSVLLLENLKTVSFFPVCMHLEYSGITFYIGHYYVMKSRVIKLNVNLEVLPCFVDKLFTNFPATSCSDSISICDK